MVSPLKAHETHYPTRLRAAVLDVFDWSGLPDFM